MADQVTSTPGSAGSIRLDRQLLSRVAATLLLCAGVDLLVWFTGSRVLTGHIDIVGYPTYYDYDSFRPFLGYRLIAYALPVEAIVIYLILERWGPLRERIPFGDGRADLIVDRPELTPAVGGRGLLTVRALWCLIPTAVFVAFTTRTRTPVSLAETTWLRVATAAGYVAFVLAASGLLFVANRSRRWRPEWDFNAWLALAGGVGSAAAAFWGTWFVSHQAVIILGDGSQNVCSWIPWWLAAAATLSAWTWLAVRIRAGRTPADVEQRLRVVLVGAAAVYVLMLQVQGAYASFAGFDPTQGVTAANLLDRGYFPWRDMQFIHGLLYDVLDPWIGMHVFQNSAWGAAMSNGVIFLPLSWSCVYLLGVWAAPRRSLAVLATFLVAASACLYLDMRFILVPIVLIVLGKVLADPRRRFSWIVLLGVLLFIEGIAMPETEEQVIAVLVVMVLADFVHRPLGGAWYSAFRRTGVLIATGAVLLGAWLIFLAVEGALHEFIDYYLVFLPGHDVEGAYPDPGHSVNVTTWIMFSFMIAGSVGVVLAAAWRVRHRRPWRVTSWIALAIALNALVYGEQALGRWDEGHVELSTDIGLSLFVVLMGSTIAPRLEQGAAWCVQRVRRSRVKFEPGLQPVGWVIVVVVVALVPSLATRIWHSPRNTRIAVGPAIQTPKMGYVVPGWIPDGLLPDLRRIQSTYARPNAPFLDMTANPGWFYYLLGFKPASVFTNITQVIPEKAQQLMIGQLRKSRAPLVAFAEVAAGADGWDGIENEVRSFAVSQYLLNTYKPLLVSQGILFMLRNNLVKSRPTVPRLTQKPLTTDLYGAEQEGCQWGDSANFLQSQPSGRTIVLQGLGVARVRTVTVSGWAFDPNTETIPSHVVVAVGGREIGTLPMTVVRPDVAATFHTDKALHSGYDGNISTTRSGDVAVYWRRGNTLEELPSHGVNESAVPGSTVRMRDGETLTVAPAPSGSVDSSTATQFGARTAFRVPANVSPSDFALATLAAREPIGTAQVTISSTPIPQESQSISAGSLPQTGSSLPIRVGSCLAWHGFGRARKLYVMETGGHAITSMTLSGVRS